MPSLHETQAAFRDAIVSLDPQLPTSLIAPAPLAGRLAIYRRHFREALVRHIVGRFPTVEWLIGSRAIAELAEPFVRASPPTAPCLAEYGSDFVGALRLSDGMPPYLADVGVLDWALGDVAVAIDHAPLSIAALASHPAESLPDLDLRLQPGVRYRRSDWPVDELVQIRLSEKAPDHLHFVPHAVALEIRGARGQFRIGRLDPAAYEFRSLLAVGEPLGIAIAGALAADPSFDVSGAIAAVFAEGLVVEVSPSNQE